MTQNENERPRKNTSSGGRGKPGRKRPGENFIPDFSWGEVDDVEQADLIQPSKSNRKRSRNRVEKIESTLTVENPQADLYKKKAAKRAARATADRPPVTDPELALPSYGKKFDSDLDDDYEFFLRNAEEAEKKKLARKERAPAKKTPASESAAKRSRPASDAKEEISSRPMKENRREEEKPAAGKERRSEPRAERRENKPPRRQESRTTSPEKSGAETDRRRKEKTPEKNSADVERVNAMREKAAERLRRTGLTENEIRPLVARIENADGLVNLLEQLLDGTLLPKEPESASVERRTKQSESAERKRPERDEKRLVREEKRPVRDEKRPVREEKRSERDEKRPVREEKRPVRDEKRPVREEKRSERDEMRPEREEKRPVREEKRSEREARRPERDEKRPESTEKKRPVREEKRSERTRDAVSVDREPKLSGPESTRTFGDIQLSDLMLEMLQEASYLEPTQIQAGTIPRILEGVDLMGQSQTGSGKTAAFMIPIIEGIESCEPGDDPVALVVVPTRELAVQIRDETVKLSRNREIITVACYGGKPIVDQVKKMRNGVDIVIGTPGRLLDLAKRRAISFSRLRWVVLDEADRMLDIGFRPDIERILKMTPSGRQTLLFSATLADEVVRLAQRYMREPETYDFSDKQMSSDTIEQYYLTVDRERKFDALLKLLERENPTQAIVFCRTKRMVDKLGRGLAHDYRENVAAIHGDLTQSQRDSIMRAFRGGKVKILVATDVVGRGIDISGISHIINYDIPQFCDDYIHRVGRTGRMGREGVAFTLVTSQEGAELTRIEMRINRLLKRAELEGFEAFARPVDSDEPGKENEPKEVKAVFGKPTRRIRRAL